MIKSSSLKNMIQSSVRMMNVPIGSQTMGMRGGTLQSDFWQRGRSYRFREFSTSKTCLSKGKDSDGYGSDDDHKELKSLYGNYEIVYPQTVSPRLDVPSHIQVPDYLSTPDGSPPGPKKKGPFLRTKDDLEVMRDTCRLAKSVLRKTISEAKVGVTTDELDKYAHHLIVENDAYPSALLYKKFPKSICTSVNNVACHGIPDSRKLVDGDIVSIDLMVYKNGFHGDCAETVLVGNVDEKGKALVTMANECLYMGIHQCGPNVPLEYIGQAIENYATSYDFSVVGAFAGHGVGGNIHELPDVYHYERVSPAKELMLPGMTFTIEPIVAQGMDVVKILPDGWTAVTLDGCRTAQFEETILITNKGVEILTI